MSDLRASFFITYLVLLCLSCIPAVHCIPEILRCWVGEGVDDGVGEGVDEGVGKGVGEGVGGGVGTAVQIHFETLLQLVIIGYDISE